MVKTQSTPEGPKSLVHSLAIEFQFQPNIWSPTESLPKASSFEEVWFTANATMTKVKAKRLEAMRSTDFFGSEFIIRC